LQYMLWFAVDRARIHVWICVCACLNLTAARLDLSIEQGYMSEFVCVHVWT
jgi:hypothetical protein